MAYRLAKTKLKYYELNTPHIGRSHNLPSLPKDAPHTHCFCEIASDPEVSM
jgi:hypothetical protein